MPLALELAVKCSAIVLIGLGARELLRRRSAALRHRVLAAAILAAIIAVPLSGVLPAWELDLPGADRPAPQGRVRVTATMSAGAPSVQADTASPLLAAIVVTWAAGTALALTVLLAGFLRLARMTSNAERLRNGRWVRMADDVAASYGLRRPPALFQTDAPDMLGTWGWLRPRILLPAGAREWTDERARVVLCHELAHVRRADWPVQIGAELLRAVGWFNPLFWIACTRLRRDSEQACDDAVLGAGVAAREYAAHLLDLARGARLSSSTWVSALPMARASTLERRITAMLNPGLNRQPLSASAAWLTAIALVAIAVPIAALQTAAEGPRSLTGSVYDVSGGVLPGVALTLEDAKGLKLDATSDAAGRFEFPPVEPGDYDLQAALPGFRSLRYKLELKVARDWTRAVTLQVGDVKESIVIRAARPAEPKPASSAQGPTALRVGGNIRAPRKIHDVRPVYPDGMREAGIEGMVLLEATIAGNGAVRAVRVLSSQAHPELAVAAVDAVRQWRFEPTLLNGAPVDVTMNVTLQFELE